MEEEFKEERQVEQEKMAGREKQLEAFCGSPSPPDALETIRVARALLDEWKNTASNRDTYAQMVVLMRDGCTYPCAYRQTHFGTACLCKDVFHDIESLINKKIPSLKGKRCFVKR